MGPMNRSFADGRALKSLGLTRSRSRVVDSASHLITLSALTSTFGGIVSPICFAVFKLMTNSNLVGCSTGRIGGFGSFQYLVHIRGGAAVHVGIVHTVGHKPPGFHFCCPFV